MIDEVTTPAGWGVAERITATGGTSPVVTGDAGYGDNTTFRLEVAARGFGYVLAVKGTTSAYAIDAQPVTRSLGGGPGRPPRPAYPAPAVNLRQLALAHADQVRVTVLGTSEKADVEIIWAGRHRTAAQITRPVACLTQLSYYPHLAARARELAGSGCTIAQIAERLNAEGFRPPKRIPAFTPNAVSDLLRALGIQRSRIPARRPALAQHEWWLRDLAQHLGMSEVTLDSWVRRGWADGYLHPQARLRVVHADPAEIERLRVLHQRPRGQHNRRPWLKDQAAVMNTEQEGASSDARQPRL